MITVIKTVNFNFPNASSVEWNVTSDDPCVTISPASGTFYQSTYSIPITFNFSNSDCFTDATITAYGVDNNGCTKSQELSIVDPCSTLTVDIVGSTSPFIANVSGGTSPYNISWVWDTSQYDGFPNGSQLVLSNKDTLKSNHVVLAQVYDANGCYGSDSVTIQNCLPIIPSAYSDTALYNGSDAYSIILTEVENIGCGTLDYNTLEIVNHDTLGSIQFERVGAKGFNFEFRPNVSQSVVKISFRLKDTNGVWTNTSVITGVVIPVSTGAPISTEEIPRSKNVDVQQYQTAPTNGTEVIVPILDADNNIDFNEFAFVPNALQSLSGSVLNAVSGSAELTPNKEIKFTYNATTPVIEGIRWKAKSLDGVDTELYNLYLDPYVATKPSISNYSLSVATSNTVSDDVQARSAVPIRYIELVTAPTKGTVSSIDNMLYYTANAGTTGADSFVYRAYGTNNTYSSNVTVSMTIENAGEVLGNGLVCNEGILDLTALIAGYDGTGTWGQDAGNPDTVSLATPSAVDFTGLSYGTYLFTYTIGTSTSTITAYHREYDVTQLSGTIRYVAGTFPNYIDLTWTITGVDATLADLAIDVFEDSTPNPVDDPADYLTTVTPTSLVAGVASYSYEVLATGSSFRFKCKLTKGCGTFSDLSGTYTVV